MNPYYQDEAVTIYHGDCREIISEMEDDSMGLIATDPPYYKVKREPWDRQWDTPEGFIGWLGDLCVEWKRILQPNGSLYCFASPRMAARVEVALSRSFNVLNTITWAKPCPFSEINRGASNSGRVSKTSLRAYYPNSERIVFAEHYGADNMAKGEAGYAAQCDELRGFVFEPLRAYLDGERLRAGVGKAECNAACGFSRSAGGMASRHYFSPSQWCLPTKEHYESLRSLFNASRNGSGPEYLRREYEELRREYEELRREYEDLRRPFTVTSDDAFTDVWTFPTVSHYRGKHPCEKPVPLMEQIVRASSRDDTLVFDPFMGSGATIVAARSLGRASVGVDAVESYCEITAERCRQKVLAL